MKALFIGGSGNISTPVSKLAIERGVELYHLNRGTRKVEIPGVKVIKGDITKKDEVAAAIAGHEWDVVVNWIAFTKEDILRDYELFKDNCKQYIFISSASAYQKPLTHPVITESTPLKNPYWQYSRDKISCEETLESLYREHDFPMTIVRPSLTYDTVIPVAIGSWDDYTIIDRMKKGKPVIIHGDGSSLWTITHARDFAVGFIGLMGHQQALGQPFHITSDELLTWNQIYEAVANAAGVPLNAIHIASDFISEAAKKLDWCSMGGDFMLGNLQGDKAVSTIFDNTKIKTFVPEFNATTTFKKGIKETVEWFEADPSRMVIREENNRFMDAIIEAYQAG
ncbi:SDR family oxidoreductase [Chondrinema litorale]|uniref:SDR family oxidoreductase n=1 Tax=Chondrinema litorale TaxID=2994555 RepID=UPI0025427ED6|nr:SDR family oxidoreductase [Chondrinema litorale]UZR97275.1 SDR family oxidoreductase [Chondrinema litorale]